MRVSCVLRSSPRQYAPASEVSLTALIGFESWRCGPRQRSVNSPCVYSEICPSAVSTSSTLYGSASASRCAAEWRSTNRASGSSVSRVVRIWIGCPSSSGSRRSWTLPFWRISTPCSASFGPIARAASRPVAPSGSSSSEESGRTTRMTDQDTQHPREDDRNEETEGTPIPDPEEETGDAEDVPTAD